MSLKDQLSPEQWQALFNAPNAASTYVSMASGGGLEMVKEMINASKFIQEAATRTSGSSYGKLVDDLMDTIKGMAPRDAREIAHKYQSKDLPSFRAEAKQVVAGGAAVADTLPDGDGFKRWMLDMAREVAQTKIGGFLGIGSRSVIDEKEQAALDELASMLGL